MRELPYLLYNPSLCILFRMRGGVVTYFLSLILYKLPIELRTEIVEIPFIQPGFYLLRHLPKTLKMNDLLSVEKFRGFSCLRVSNSPDQVVTGGSGFLFCRQVLAEACYGIALGLGFTGIKGNAHSSR